MVVFGTGRRDGRRRGLTTRGERTLKTSDMRSPLDKERVCCVGPGSHGVWVTPGGQLRTYTSRRASADPP